MKWVMTESNAYAAHISPDDRRSQLFGYYGSYCVARESVKGKSWYGSDGTVNSIPTELITFTDENGESWTFPKKAAIIVQEETPEAKRKRLEKIKENALAKLNPDEREALGL
ncbi:hypothetical protein CPT_Metamorpho_207 [Klebsiella phage Metamorpho]|nr:hypothetical protein CPT_Metamorpho_207 [Klebsiella phage Metamorpho]